MQNIHLEVARHCKCDLNTTPLFTRFPASRIAVFIKHSDVGGKNHIHIHQSLEIVDFFYTPAKSFVILSLRLTQLHTFNIPLQNMAGRLMSCSDCSKSVNKIYMCLGQSESAEADRETQRKPPAAHASKQMVGKS